MKRRLALLALALALLVISTGYAFASNVVYDQLTAIDSAWCPRTFAANTPAHFVTDLQSGTPSVPTQPYLMPRFEAVRFPSRGDQATSVSGWWVPAAPGAPAVVVVHGFGRCKRDPEVLLPAGMLHRHGFAVLLIDMRNHGDSTISDRQFAFGVEEYRDVLGAWDWLRSDEGVPASRIGVYGVSGGAGTSVIAAGEEPQLAAIWVDSAWGDVDVGIQDELNRKGYPTFLAFGGLWVGRLLHGVDLTSKSPAAAAALLRGRPIYIVHGTADTRIPVKQAWLLAAAVRANGGAVEPWILPGVEHVRAAFVEPAEYERRLTDFFTSGLARTGSRAGAPGGLMADRAGRPQPARPASMSVTEVGR